MRQDIFRDSTSGHLVKSHHEHHEYWAFVPNPLPPEFVITPRLFKINSEADRALAELAGLGRNLANPQLLIAPFLRREAVESSRIEGTQTGIADLYAYEAGQLSLPGIGPPPPEADIKEVRNYVFALETGLERIRTFPISLRLIRELHAILMQDVRGRRASPGEFRSNQNWIGGTFDGPQTAKFVPPPQTELLRTLDNLEKYIHEDQ